MSAYDDLFGGNALRHTSNSTTSLTSVLSPSSSSSSTSMMSNLTDLSSTTGSKKKNSKSIPSTTSTISILNSTSNTIHPPTSVAQKVSTTARKVPVIPASWTARYQTITKSNPPTVVKAKSTMPVLSKSSEKILSSLEKKQEEQLQLQLQQQKSKSIPSTSSLHDSALSSMNSETKVMLSTESVQEKSGLTEKVAMSGGNNVGKKKNNKKTRTSSKAFYEENYDPSRPNDYEAYKKWRKEVHALKHPIPSSESQVYPSSTTHDISIPASSLFLSSMDAPSFPLLSTASEHSSFYSSSSLSDEEDEDEEDEFEEDEDGDLKIKDAEPLDGYPLDPPLDAMKLPEFLRLFFEGVGDQERLYRALKVELERLSSSRVVLLCNMVDPGDVDGELKSETAEECSKFGKVIDCHVHEIVGPQLPNDAVRIFVEFDSSDAAQRAVAELNGRFFSGRKVLARLYDNQAFHSKAYEE